MSMNDPLADMLTRIRNALMRNFPTVEVPESSFKKEILAVFKEEGYITDFVSTGTTAATKTLVVTLRYYNEKPAIREVKRASRPGLRHYVQHREIPRIYGGLGTAVLSTSKGVLSGRKALVEGVGGELICTLF